MKLKEKTNGKKIQDEIFLKMNWHDDILNWCRSTQVNMVNLWHES